MEARLIKKRGNKLLSQAMMMRIKEMEKKHDHLPGTTNIFKEELQDFSGSDADTHNAGVRGSAGYGDLYDQGNRVFGRIVKSEYQEYDGIRVISGVVKTEDHSCPTLLTDHVVTKDCPDASLLLSFPTPGRSDEEDTEEEIRAANMKYQGLESNNNYSGIRNNNDEVISMGTPNVEGIYEKGSSEPAV